MATKGYQAPAPAMPAAGGGAGSGSGGGNSVVSSLAEERPSFARRTLLWVVGGRPQSNRVGDCS